MARYRSTLAWILGLVAVFLVSCSGPTTATVAPTYTPVQLAQIRQYESKVVELRQRLPALATLIENRNWTDVRTFIHGPLGELRVRMSILARTLLPEAEATATAAAKEISGHFVEIDEAAVNEDYRQAIRNYAEAVKDFDVLLKVIPQG